MYITKPISIILNPLFNIPCSFVPSSLIFPPLFLICLTFFQISILFFLFFPLLSSSFLFFPLLSSSFLFFPLLSSSFLFFPLYSIHFIFFLFSLFNKQCIKIETIAAKEANRFANSVFQSLLSIDKSKLLHFFCFISHYLFIECFRFYFIWHIYFLFCHFEIEYGLLKWYKI